MAIQLYCPHFLSRRKVWMTWYIDIDDALFFWGVLLVLLYFCQPTINASIYAVFIRSIFLVAFLRALIQIKLDIPGLKWY